jgi:hypothetical protein
MSEFSLTAPASHVRQQMQIPATPHSAAQAFPNVLEVRCSIQQAQLFVPAVTRW